MGLLSTKVILDKKANGVWVGHHCDCMKRVVPRLSMSASNIAMKWNLIPLYTHLHTKLFPWKDFLFGRPTKSSIASRMERFLGNGSKSFQHSARVIVMGRSNQLWSTWLPSKLLENYWGLQSSSKTLVPVVHHARKLKIDLRTSPLRNNRFLSTDKNVFGR